MLKQTILKSHSVAAGETYNRYCHEFSLENRIKVNSLFEVGLDDEADIAGYHGTSLHAVIEIIKTGRLPAGVGHSVVGGQEDQGKLFFFPTFDLDSIAKNYTCPGASPQESCEMYAEKSAKLHYILSSLNLDRNNPEIVGRIDYLMHEDIKLSVQETVDEVQKLCRSEGISRALIINIWKESKSLPKGCILGFKRSSLDLGYEWNGAEGICLRCPKGLSIEHIAGIEPLGQYESDFFDLLYENLQLSV